MRTIAGDPMVRQAQAERIILTGFGDGKPRTAATGPNGRYPPPATPDTFGQATDPRRVRVFFTGAPGAGFWTSTGRLSPKNGRLRPVCRYIGP